MMKLLFIFFFILFLGNCGTDKVKPIKNKVIKKPILKKEIPKEEKKEPIKEPIKEVIETKKEEKKEPIKKVIVEKSIKSDKDIQKCIQNIQNGMNRCLDDIKFKNLKDLFLFLRKKAEESKQSSIDYLIGIDDFGQKIRSQKIRSQKIRSQKIRRMKSKKIALLIKSFVIGLLNKDPRIRLSCILTVKKLFQKLKRQNFFLRRKRKSKREFNDQKLFYKKVKRSIHKYTRHAWYIETVNKTIYETIDINGQKVKGIVYNNMNDLDLYISRAVILDEIRKGNLKPENFKDTSRRIFKILTLKLKDDRERDIPIYFIKDKVEILLNSLKNFNEEIRKEAIKYIIKIYYHQNLDNENKNKIDVARKEYQDLNQGFIKYFNKKISLRSNQSA